MEKIPQPVTTVKLTDLAGNGKRFLLFLLSQAKLFVIVTLVTTGLALLYYRIQQPKYEAVATFILEEKTTGGGGLAGLASQFGLEIGGLSGGAGIFAGDNILDILKSRMIMEKVLLTKADSSKGAHSQTLADLFIENNRWKKKYSEMASLSYADCTPGAPHSLLQDSVLYLVYQQLYKKQVSTERLNKKGSIIRVAVTSGDQVFAKSFTDRLLYEARKMYIDVKTNNAQYNVARLEKRADSLLAVLNEKSYQSAGLQIVDVNPVYKQSVVPVELSQREKSVVSAVYAEVVKNLELSRLALSQQMPVIQLLDTPKYPLDDQLKSLGFLLLAGILAGLAISIGICYFRYGA